MSNKTLTFSYDGFLGGSNVDEMTISHESRANVIEPSGAGKQCMVICNFTMTYPSLPVPISRVMFKNVIIIRPWTSKPTGKYGASLKIRIAQDTLAGFVRAAANSGCVVEGNLDFSNGHYWINCTTGDSAAALFYIINGDDINEVIEAYNTPCITVGYAKLDLKLKTSVPDPSADMDNMEARRELKWTISAKMYVCYLMDLSDVGPLNVQDSAIEFHDKLVGSNLLPTKFGMKKP